jgi:glycosyltransferase involved in cell wall biosynthesis
MKYAHHQRSNPTPHDEGRVLWDWPHSADIVGVSFERILSQLPAGKAINKCPPLRALALWRVARRYEVVVIGLAGPTSRIFLALARLRPRAHKYLVILHFIPEVSRVPTTSYRGQLLHLLKLCYLRTLLRPVVQRSVLSCQVLTRWEASRNSAFFDVPETVMRVTRYPLRQTDDPRPSRPATDGVLASGRAACDWDTVFAAAERGDWPLTVICGKRDLARVRRLNKRKRASVFVDVPVEAHQLMMERAQVYLLALNDHQASSGQIRLSNAVRAGTPAVVANVPGINEYVVADSTALTYGPGDDRTAAHQVQRLLDSPQLREAVAAAAFEAAGKWTREDYRLAMQRIVIDATLAKRSNAAVTTHTRGR